MGFKKRCQNQEDWLWPQGQKKVTDSRDISEKSLTGFQVSKEKGRITFYGENLRHEKEGNPIYYDLFKKEKSQYPVI